MENSLGRMNNVAARHRRQAQVAAHQMQVIARQQNDLAGPNHEVLSVLTVDSDMKVALDDVVINNQVGCWPEKRRAVLGRDAGRDTPRREELGVQENAACQMRHPQDVGERHSMAADKPDYGSLGGSPQCGRCAHTIKRIMEKITANGPAPTAAVRRRWEACQEDRPVRKVGPGDDFLL
jgi:hypothetical protein